MKVDLSLIAAFVEEGRFLEASEYLNEERYNLTFLGKVKAKERPRAGKGGRMYTPAATRQFEKEVEAWAKRIWQTPPLRFPVKIRISIVEGTSDDTLINLSNHGLVYNQKGDLDNLAKSLLDGMNGVVYVDDKQIADLHISRRYGVRDYAEIIVYRHGLTSLEYSNLMRRLK